jgi:hypothetical protein
MDVAEYQALQGRVSSEKTTVRPAKVTPRIRPKDKSFTYPKAPRLLTAPTPMLLGQAAMAVGIGFALPGSDTSEEEVTCLMI